ncbi:MAG TPA: TetR family transcriptional regulator [Kofleriaceae bacterium]|jgi:AcrR family transcriptional regulator
MSTAYEQDGRTAQKQRTRGALMDAARRLLAGGTVPTVEAAAAAASISRTTAYRYFPSQGALLLAAHPELTPASLLPRDAPADAADRVDCVVAELIRKTIQAEPQLRAILRHSLAPDPAERGDLSLRRGRAIDWIQEALSAPDVRLSAAERRRLAIAIRSATGIEALVWLTDVAGLDRRQAMDIQRWSARAMVRAALEPPSTRRPGRKRRGPRRSAT